MLSSVTFRGSEQSAEDGSTAVIAASVMKIGTTNRSNDGSHIYDQFVRNLDAFNTLLVNASVLIHTHDVYLSLNLNNHPSLSFPGKDLKFPNFRLCRSISRETAEVARNSSAGDRL